MGCTVIALPAPIDAITSLKPPKGWVVDGVLSEMTKCWVMGSTESVDRARAALNVDLIPRNETPQIAEFAGGGP